MWLPKPSDDAVEQFRKLALEELGIELDYAAAREAATQVLHMYFLKEHVPAHGTPAGSRRRSGSDR